MRTRVYLEEAGCDRRRLDMGTIRGYLAANDYEVVPSPADAQAILVSTCAFKQREEEESVRRLRLLRKYGLPIVIYGCLPDIAGGRYPEFDDLPFVAPREIEAIASHFRARKVAFSDVKEAHVLKNPALDFSTVKRRMEVGWPSRDVLFHQARVIGARRIKQVFARPDVPFRLFVCRGCAGECSYCAIKRAIGRVRSRPIEGVLADLQSGLAEGYRSFTILGDDPGCYGLDTSTTFPRLLAALFDTCDAEEARTPVNQDARDEIRFRIEEIHPKFLIRYHDELLGLEGFRRVEEVLCPVQSGKDRILDLMRREHSASDLLGALRAIREHSPDMRLSTQIIVGFPTETPEDFEETLNVVAAGEFDSVVVFPYHGKEGSPSGELDGSITEDEIARRMRRAFQYFKQHGIPAYYSCP